MVDIEDSADLHYFLKALTKLSFVKSVKLVNRENHESNLPLVNEGLEEYNWTNPSRPASDAEIEVLIEKMESSEVGFTTDEVREKMGQWAAQK